MRTLCGAPSQRSENLNFNPISILLLPCLCINDEVRILKKKKCCVFTLRYTYGKPVQGDMNITYLHHFHGIEDVYDEFSEVCIFMLKEAE